jgi:hypothetical protein
MEVKTLDEQEVKNFFSEFLRVYRDAVGKELITYADKLPLYSSVPVKIEIWMDYDNTYATVVLSKTGSGVVVEKLQDPLMCIATANSKRFEYGEQRKFLYLFQVNAKRFSEWKPDKFAEDFIKYELTTSGKQR